MTTRKHFTARLPDTLALALAQQAESNHRSANAELVAILQREFSPRMFERPVSGTASTTELDQYKAALALCVESLDQLIPYLGKVPADIGLLNDALCAARPLLDKGNTP